jgi:hypothetical protein
MMFGDVLRAFVQIVEVSVRQRLSPPRTRPRAGFPQIERRSRRE